MKVLTWGMSLCGLQFGQEDFENVYGIQINVDQLTQIREERLTKMMNIEIVENEVCWLTYDDELTEVGMILSDHVFDVLLQDLINDFFK
jgi:regulator of PEP synthase PpsR (kinase-PPPase family)